jgi:hypothetical protein
VLASLSSDFSRQCPPSQFDLRVAMRNEDDVGGLAHACGESGEVGAPPCTFRAGEELERALLPEWLLEPLD